MGNRTSIKQQLQTVSVSKTQLKNQFSNKTTWIPHKITNIKILYSNNINKIISGQTMITAIEAIIIL